MGGVRTGTGFGHFKFGNFPFGSSNYGEDVITRSFPDSYLEDDNGNPNELLVHYLLTIEDSVNRVKQQIDEVPDQVDFDRIRSDLLSFLGSTIDVTIDSSEPEEFQRSLVGNAIQFYEIKGTLNSYKIRGKISGFDVTIDNLYKINPDLVPFFADDDIFNVPADSENFFTVLPPGSVSGDSRLSGASCDYCLTAAIKLNFEIVRELPAAIAGEGNFFDRLATKLQDIIPIHVRDLLFEIRAVICVSGNDQIVNISGQEQGHFPASQFFHFDMTPADVVPTDFHGGVSGLATSTP